MNLEKLTIFFQPIISTSSRRIFAVEALLRAIDHDGNIIPPYEIFNSCETSEQLEYISNEAIMLTFEKFNIIQKTYPNILLFINIEPSLIDSKWKKFKPLLLNHDVSYSNIVLEIKEEFIKDLNFLTEFCQFFRDKDFFIALDDFGSGCSNFERINSIKPDVIKLDRSLIQDLHKNVVHQEIVKSIINMTHTLGSAILAEGVEDLEDIIYARTQGVTLFQGFFFDRPMNKLDVLNYYNKVENIEKLVSEDTILKMKKRKKQFEHAKYIAVSISNIIKGRVNCTDLLSCIEPILERHAELEAFYILNSDGKQLGKTAMRLDVNPFYLPAPAHYDHSGKEYFSIAKESQNGKYLSKRYISQASGNLCKTYVHKIEILGDEHFLCIDFKTNLKEY